MGKLFKLKEWLTLDEAATHISNVLGESATVADLYRFALDDHLTLSVDFVNHAYARKGKWLKTEQVEFRLVENDLFSGEKLDIPFSMPVNHEIRVSDDDWISLEKPVVSIEGIWDLTMVGAEKLDIEHYYQQLTSGLKVTLVAIDGLFVQQGGVVCQLQADFDNNEYQQGSKAQKKDMERYIATNELSKDKVKKLQEEYKKDRDEYLISRKNKPNENLARELLELYTMGEGSHYSEEDVKGVAKALTGYRINYKDQNLVFKWNKHNSEPKTIFGQTGNYNLDDVLNIILEQPKVAEFIVIKLWHEFVSNSIPDNEKERLTSVFLDSDYDIKKLLVNMLNSPYFWAKDNRNNLVKSPFDLLTSTAFLLDMPNSDSIKLPALLARAGQKLFYPPDVRGWRGGSNWLNAELIISRKQLLNRYLNKLIKASKQENPDFIKDLNRKLNKRLQFFAIGQETPDRIKWPKNRLKFVLLNDYYHFK